tara:strand:+ start:3009 stop:3386 length:378 start_codon:yes stop_codon:yes gene_type:complete
MKPKTTRSKRSRKSPQNKSVKRRGGGWFEGLAGLTLGASRIRGQRYEHWLEDRLVLVYNDINYVNKVRALFKYDKTSLKSFTRESVIADACNRIPEDKAIILTNQSGTNMSNTLCKAVAPVPPST